MKDVFQIHSSGLLWGGKQKNGACKGYREDFNLICNFCQVFIIFFNKFIYFIYLFLAALGLRCCSSCGERGLLFVAVHGLLIAVASLVAEHGL